MISIFVLLFHRVKFGVPLDEVCKNDIPGPLLVRDECQTQML